MEQLIFDKIGKQRVPAKLEGMQRLQYMMESFTRTDVDIGRITTQKRKHGPTAPLDIHVTQEVNVPGGLSSEQWQQMDTSHRRYEIHAYGQNTPPSKKAPVWDVKNKETRLAVAVNKTYAEALDIAIAGVLEALKDVTK